MSAVWIKIVSNVKVSEKSNHFFRISILSSVKSNSDLIHFLPNRTQQDSLLLGWNKFLELLKKLSQFSAKSRDMGLFSVAALKRGGGSVGKAKLRRRKERAEQSAGPRGSRQNVGRGVFGASHGYRSENGAAGPPRNLILQQARVIISCSPHTGQSDWPFLAVEGAWAPKLVFCPLNRNNSGGGQRMKRQLSTYKPSFS